MMRSRVHQTGERAGARLINAVAGAVVLALASAMAARAQNAPPATSNETADTGQLQTVEVTARYTQENLQTTPLAITALSGAQLEQRNVLSTADLGAVIPNLYTHPGDQEEGPTPTISMRGVTAGDYSFALSPAVGIYVDDVYHSTMVGADLDLADVDRIEVKRGPQGTLSGNASIGGTISLFSKVPQGDDTGYLSAGYGSYNEVEVKGAYDATIAPDLFMRVFAEEKRQDGYMDQLDFTCEMNALGTPQLAGTFPSRDNSAYERGCKIGSFGGTDVSDVKVMLRYVATDKLEFNLSAAYYDEVDEMAPEVLLKPEPPISAAKDSAALLSMYGVVFDDRFLPPPGDPYSSYSVPCQILTGRCDNNQQGQNSSDFSLKIDYDVTDKIHIKGIGAASLYGGLSTNNPDVSALGYNLDQVYFNINQYTGEVRINGKAFDDRLDWVGGVFILDATDHLSGAIDIPSVVFTENDHFTDQSRSGFVHADYKLTDRWSVSAGGRVSHDSKTADLNHPGLLTDIVPFTVSESHTDWLVATNYKITDDTMAYVTIATGSRPPGISTVVFTKYQLSSFPGEAMTSYEAGLKNEFFDHRLRVNVDGFYMDYSKRLTGVTQYQCLGGPLAGPPPTAVTLNTECGANGFVPWPHTIATPAKVTGFEWELTAEPIERLLVNLDGGYNHLESGIKTLGQPGYIYPGNYPQPQWNASAGVQYTVKFANAGTLTPRLDWVYTSLQTFDPAPSNESPSSLYEVPAHSLLNGQISYSPEDSKWTWMLSGTNLTNKYYLYDIFTGSGTAVTGNLAPPRMWLLQLKRQF
jgi:iron complex outermembrane recepter protein